MRRDSVSDRRDDAAVATLRPRRGSSAAAATRIALRPRARSGRGDAARRVTATPSCRRDASEGPGRSGQHSLGSRHRRRGFSRRFAKTRARRLRLGCRLARPLPHGRNRRDARARTARNPNVASLSSGRGGAAAGSSVNGSRRRRGQDLDRPRTCCGGAAARSSVDGSPQRRSGGPGPSVDRGGVAARTWIVRGRNAAAARTWIRPWTERRRG